MGQFRFDGQLHIPQDRLMTSIEVASSNKLDAIAYTDYSHTKNFDFLAEKNNVRMTATSRAWKVEHVSPVVLRLHSGEDDLYVIKAEEIKTNQGHILAWGIRHALPSGEEYYDTMQQIFDQGGLVVFDHLLSKRFNGCGAQVFLDALDQFPGEPIAVEQNGQIPDYYSFNQDVADLARTHGVACFGTSDIHGKYLKEYMKIGKRLHSVIDGDYITPSDIIGSLKYIMYSEPEAVTIEGKVNSYFESLAWNLESIRQNGWKKIAENIMGTKKSKTRNY